MQLLSIEQFCTPCQLSLVDTLCSCAIICKDVSRKCGFSRTSQHLLFFRFQWPRTMGQTIFWNHFGMVKTPNAMQCHHIVSRFVPISFRNVFKCDFKTNLRHTGSLKRRRQRILNLGFSFAFYFQAEKSNGTGNISYISVPAVAGGHQITTWK